jgi:hypothetical protein
VEGGKKTGREGRKGGMEGGREKKGRKEIKSSFGHRGASSLGGGLWFLPC